MEVRSYQVSYTVKPNRNVSEYRDCVRIVKAYDAKDAQYQVELTMKPWSDPSLKSGDMLFCGVHKVEPIVLLKEDPDA